MTKFNNEIKINFLSTKIIIRAFKLKKTLMHTNHQIYFYNNEKKIK